MTPHHSCTTVLNKEGWELIVCFLDAENDQQPDDYITESELRPYHEAVRFVTEVFGLPQKGDIINCGSDIVTVQNRWFDLEKKQVVIDVK